MIIQLLPDGSHALIAEDAATFPDDHPGWERLAAALAETDTEEDGE